MTLQTTNRAPPPSAPTMPDVAYEDGDVVDTHAGSTTARETTRTAAIPNGIVTDEDESHGNHTLMRGNENNASDVNEPCNDDEDEDVDDDDMRDAGCFYRALRRCPRCYKFLLRWPRMSAVILGVTVPMFFLIFLSVVFGLFLAYAEAPLEVQQNDAAVAQNELELFTLTTVVNVTDITPSLCLNMFLRDLNVTSIHSFLLQHIFLPNASLTSGSNALPASSAQYLNFNESSQLLTFNATYLSAFMTACGAEVSPIVQRLFRNASAAYQDAVANSLTFNWIRCYPGANGLGSKTGTMNVANIEEVRYDAQREWYFRSWKKSQFAIYTVLLEELISTGNMTLENAKLQATRESYNLASGGKGCALNAAAAGWFWFTVLSTCGYGNTAPETQAGQAMVYTLGFLSILAFAGILATAGFIASSIFDDAVVRLRIRALTHPLVATFVWGALYYLWMLAIAAATINWKHVRLGDETFGMSQGYWFAYISSTTVGLGDEFFQPEVFLYRDLLLFPLMWLVSFVLVAAFLSKFAEAWIRIIGKKSYVADSLSRLHTTDMLDDLPGWESCCTGRRKSCYRRLNRMEKRHESDDSNGVSSGVKTSATPGHTLISDSTP